MTQNAVVTKLISRHVAEVAEAFGMRATFFLGAAALLYLVPFVLLFLGYAIGSALGWGEGGCVLIGFAFFALGVACNVVYQRRKKASPITFEIIQVLET